jgi:trehalose 6-phosphate phosphatase
MDDEHFDDPSELALVLHAAARPLLIGLDVDGVLAPIAAHPDEAKVRPGVHECIAALATVNDVHMAIVSGRALADLARFDFPARAMLVGSHGMEISGRDIHPLDPVESSRLLALDELASAAGDVVGPGTWVERKPASVVLHVRQADPERANGALVDLIESARSIVGATVKRGSGVLELFARSASKGDALARLAAELGALSTAYAGDDVTDEDAFAVLGPTDVTVKVGLGTTLAHHRLRDPDDVAAWLRHLTETLV